MQEYIAEGSFKAEFLVCSKPCSGICRDGVCPNRRREIKMLEKIIFSLPEGELTVFPGFVFDGASIPRCCWTITGHPLEHRFLYAALLHDVLYSAGYLSRKQADQCFRSFLSRFAGVGKFSAWKMYVAVRIFGGIAWNGKTETQKTAARTCSTWKGLAE